jgi:phage protein U
MHQLGNIKFTGFVNPSQFETAYEATYAEHPKLQGKPALQRTGDKLTTVSLTMNLSAGFCTPENEISKLQAYLDSGEVVGLSTTDGDFFGDFVVTAVSVSRLSSYPGGSIRDAAVSVSLLEWATVDGAAEREMAARNDGFAVGDNAVTTTTTANATTRVESEAMDQAMATAGSSAAIDSSINVAIQFPDQDTHQRAVMDRKLDKVIADSTACRSTINALTGDKFTETRTMETDLLAVIAQANAMKAVINSASLQDLTTLNFTLRTLCSTLKRSSTILSTYVTARK